MTCAWRHEQCGHPAVCWFNNLSDDLLRLIISEPRLSMRVNLTRDPNVIEIVIQGYLRQRRFMFGGVMGPGFPMFPSFLRRARNVGFTLKRKDGSERRARGLGRVMVFSPEFKLR